MPIFSSYERKVLENFKTQKVISTDEEYRVLEVNSGIGFIKYFFN